MWYQNLGSHQHFDRTNVPTTATTREVNLFDKSNELEKWFVILCRIPSLSICILHKKTGMQSILGLHHPLPPPPKRRQHYPTPSFKKVNTFYFITYSNMFQMYFDMFFFPSYAYFLNTLAHCQHCWFTVVFLWFPWYQLKLERWHKALLGRERNCIYALQHKRMGTSDFSQDYKFIT